MRVPATNDQRYGFKTRYAFEIVSSSHAICGAAIPLPVIFMPNHRQNPYIGMTVQGLLIKAAESTTSLLNRNAHARKRQLRVCNPMVGVNAIKTPRAKADASLPGESSSLKMLLMRSLKYLL